MASQTNVSFSSFDAAGKGVLVLLAGAEAALAPSIDQDLAALAKRAGSAAKFKGKRFASVETLAPEGSPFERIVLVGTDDKEALSEEDWLKVGGTIVAKTSGASNVTIRCETESGPLDASASAGIALGAVLRGYKFDRYKTKKESAERTAEEAQKVEAPAALVLAVGDPAAAEAAFERLRAVGDGVALARDLVNEPANVLTTLEYAARIETLRDHGLEVEILDEDQMAELKMHALLGVSRGSPTPARLAIMRWNGGAEGEAPIAFVGKGVVFDTGGISIKPAASMEDMKGDMGGSAAVVGLMRALAGRKAKVNVVGIVGLVENAVDGKAQRPGDIVTAMSGKTVEVLNTDAEGRLVLADALWYCQDRFRPRFMVNLATLTGAIIVALGHHHAGLFSNDDDLSDRLLEAGRSTGEKVWRLPLGKEYAKQIEGKFADIKNIGNGRAAGSITAAEFLQHFVNDVPWAHLDIAGTAFGAPSSEYNQSWGSGFGVRLLERLVADHYEAR